MQKQLYKATLNGRSATVIASTYEEAVDLLNLEDVANDWRDALMEVVSTVYPQLASHVLSME